jgi:transketolase
VSESAPAPAPAPAPTIDLEEVAHRIRRRVLEMCVGRRQGYAGQGLELADVLAHLCFRVMRRRPAGGGPSVSPFLDHLVLSTGHSAIALFAALGELGLYEQDELDTYGQAGSRIEESPLEGTPGFEITGGSLGQGMSQAVGMALGERLRGSGAKTYCLVSDGELQEGQFWEAAMAASHHRLDDVVVLVDNNRIQADGATGEVMEVEPVDRRLEAFGFATVRVDAHDHKVLEEVLPPASVVVPGPRAIVLETVPGKGVPSFEANHKVHYLRLDRSVWEQALRELG